ncbi:Tim17/Tim22/Tim23/Pmp24 family-domain-containing protein [Tribonema minus]|uniref:Mitochondrial import inner membrane translocase subunit TIM22 n=1 Tax=Tribonema minus TaxID=303371 RepID=A0A835Z765_9STRA|nr:Tim17/Tim22/Tim23/Pmp24 family-domain-containing protein [Tribonema minus]
MRTPAVTVLCFSLLCSSVLGLACTSSVVLSSPVRRSRKGQSPLALVVLRPPEDGVLVPVSAPTADCRAIVAARDALEAAVAPLTTIAKTASGRSESGFFECCMEVGLTTVGSLVSGGVLGYIIGWGIGIAQKGAFEGGLGNAIKAMHAKGRQTGSSWGLITACFSGFTSAARVMRGREDHWNSILGSCGTGAVMCRDRGVGGMLQGCLAYGAFSYILDMVGGHPSVTDELDFVDIAVDNEGGSRSRQRRRLSKSARPAVGRTS